MQRNPQQYAKTFFHFRIYYTGEELFANSFDDDLDEDFRRKPQDKLHCTCLLSHKNEHNPEYTPVKTFCSDKPGSSRESPEPEKPKISPSTSHVTTSSLQGPPDIKHWLNMFQNWSNSNKVQTSDAIISLCSPGQVCHMKKFIKPIYQRDFISLLPKELALIILGYLHPKDLLRVAQTCRYWQFLADDDIFWREHCRRMHVVPFNELTKSLPKCANPWKVAYMRLYLNEYNWLSKAVNRPIIMRGAGHDVIANLQLSGDRIISGAVDSTLKIWCAVSGQCLRTLVGYAGGVWSAQSDRALRVWNASTVHRDWVLAAPNCATVRGMKLYGNIVVSGFRNEMLRVWVVPVGPNKHQAVTCLMSFKRFAVSISDDGMLKLWDFHTGDFIRNLVRLGSGGSGGVVWRIRASSSKLVCAVGSRNGTEETKLLVLDFDLPGACRKCDE